MSERPAAPDPLLEILAGKVRAQAVSTAAGLGLADALDAGERDTAGLAAELGCETGGLRSLLCVLVGVGVVDEPSPDHWRITALGRRLRRDDLGPLAEFVGAPEQWDPWARLRDALRTAGRCAFEHTYGKSLYELVADDPAVARRYNRAIDAYTRHEAVRVCDAFDFRDVRSLVDVGGGHGALLAEILRRHPAVRGMLFDLPHAVAGAAAALRDEFGDRVEVRAGDFRHSLPAGHDTYLLKHVLHNWPDEVARRILEHGRHAAGPGGRVLVIDAILPPGGRAGAPGLLDLEMRVLTGGHQRRKPELRRLLHSAGLRVDELRQLTDTAWLFVATPRRGR